MRKLILILLIAAGVVAAGPRKSPSGPAKKAENASVRRKTIRPLSVLRRIARAEPDFALRFSSWGIKREPPE